MLSASQCLLKNDNLMHRDKRWGWGGGGGRIPGSSFMELEKFRLCQAKMWEERTRAKHGGLSSRTMSTALVTLEQGWIVPGSCITHKANFCLTEQQGFFSFFFFLWKEDLIFKCHKILGNGIFVWSSAMQLGNYTAVLACHLVYKYQKSCVIECCTMNIFIQICIINNGSGWEEMLSA